MASNMRVRLPQQEESDDVLVRVLLNEKDSVFRFPATRLPTTGGRISGTSMPESCRKPDLNSSHEMKPIRKMRLFAAWRSAAGGDRPDRCRRTRQGRTHGCRLRRRSASGGRLRVGRRAVRDDRRRRPLPHRIRQVGGLRLRRHAVGAGSLPRPTASAAFWAALDRQDARDEQRLPFASIDQSRYTVMFFTDHLTQLSEKRSRSLPQHRAGVDLRRGGAGVGARTGLLAQFGRSVARSLLVSVRFRRFLGQTFPRTKRFSDVAVQHSGQPRQRRGDARRSRCRPSCRTSLSPYVRPDLLCDEYRRRALDHDGQHHL